MIWIGRKTYTDAHYAEKLAEIGRNVQSSTKHMALVAGLAVAVLFLADAACIYVL